MHQVSRHSYSVGGLIERFVDNFNFCPWGSSSAGGGSDRKLDAVKSFASIPLYTQEQRRRRDQSPWTTVQGVLAPLQFAVFALSLGLVVSYLRTGEGLPAATYSILAKTLVLYAIMVTGSIWEHAVFGRYLFAPAFFWEDVVSIGVLVLHTAYVCVLMMGGSVELQIGVALAAYAAYLFNAGQYVLKLRAARLERPVPALAHGRADQ
jgi:3-vinyl bacteriochlorophyllide hydratase